MPVEFLSDEQVAAYGRFNGEPTRAELERFFFLDDDDRRRVQQRRGEHHRVGFAVQVGTVRFLGTFLSDWTAAPSGVVRYVADQLAATPASDELMRRYVERGKTPLEHSWEIREALGYRDFGSTESAVREFLEARAWTRPERPSRLFDQAVARLRCHKILLPGVSVLAQLVSQVRTEMSERLYSRLAGRVSAELGQRLDKLLTVGGGPAMTDIPPEPSGVVPPAVLSRRLGVFDAVIIGLGSMIGAGVFAAFAPSAKAAGAGLLIGLAVAAVVAYCNATSSARLAALYPQSGGTYVYGRRRLGDFWGYAAGWSFVVGKTASCAAIALTFASYAAPAHLRLVGILAVAVLTAVNYFGVQKSAWLTRLIVVLTLTTLTVVVMACLAGGSASTAHLSPFPGGTVRGVLQAAGLLFFAFAGYARIATLGEEVKDPARTIPRAIPIALAITLTVYAIVALSVLLAAGAPGLASTAAPLKAAVQAGSWAAVSPVVQIGGAIAALGSLLALILGVSRTTLAMARDHHLPAALAAVHPRYQVPHRAELAVGAVVIVLVATLDVRGAIGFSSFGVLAYYGIANASALTLTRAEHRAPRWIPILGLLGCVVLAFSLPTTSILSGGAVLLVGAAIWAARGRARARLASG